MRVNCEEELYPAIKLLSVEIVELLTGHNVP